MSKVELLGQVYRPIAYVGPTKCQQTTWVSGTSVICTSPVGGESLLAQLTVRVDLGAHTGELRNIAYIDDASRFDPFSTFPCPSEGRGGCSERADLAYLRCRPAQRRIFLRAVSDLESIDRSAAAALLAGGLACSPPYQTTLARAALRRQRPGALQLRTGLLEKVQRSDAHY